MKDSLIYLVQQLLYLNKINFDKKELAFQIQSHPSYPSLHAITGVLSHFDIDNLALNIPVDLGTLKQLPKCFLAQINTENGKDFAVVNKNKSQYTIRTSDKKKRAITSTQFLEKFTGIMVAVEKDELLKDKKSVKTNFDKALIILSTLVFIGLFINSKASIPFLLFLATSLIGVFISISIVEQEQGKQTVLGNAFCSGATDKKDCDAVISSKGAQIFNNFKLSDASLIYFIGLTLTSLLLFFQKSNINSVYAISLLAFPITVYSIYYQAMIVKKWCLLCLGIVGILWVQAITVFVNTNITAISFTKNSILITCLGFLISALAWNFLSPKLKLLKELQQVKIDSFKFKRNFNLFNTLLEKSKSINTTINGLNEIVFGNKKAPLNITIITNPFCGHCKGVHTLVENILKKHNNVIQIRVRFNISVNNLESDVVKITSRLLEIYQTDGKTKCRDAMHDIYGEINAEKWLKKWGNCNETKPYIAVLEKQSAWCKENDINFTPEILINGKSYPKEYNRGNLIYFIEELEESCCLKSNELQLTI